MNSTLHGNWTDTPCFYVSVVDGPQFAFLAGPFRTHQEALDMVDRARDAASGKSRAIGWVFTKRRKYEDYISETWVTIHRRMPQTTVKHYY